MALSEEQARTLVENPGYRIASSDSIFMTTRGGSHYERTFLEAFIRPGPTPEDWIARDNAPALGVVPANGREMFIYRLSHYAQPSSHMARYRLRADGFISVHAPYGGGELITRPLIFSGNHLELNFETSAAGSMRVEIQDGNGVPQAGYTLAECPEMIGDDVARTITWSGGDKLGKLAGKTVTSAFCDEGCGSLFLKVLLMKRSFLVVVVLFCLIAVNAAERTILLVDDADVLYRSGTKRVVCPLTRSSSNPIIKGGVYPWEKAIAWMSVYRNPATGKYQLWYQAFAGDAARDRTRRCVVAYAESDDGIKFKRPNLGLFDFDGIKDTSIVLVANGGTSDRYGASVIVDAREPDANRRYKMAYFDFTRDSEGHEYPGLNVAFSPDGIHWTKYPGGTLSRTARELRGPGAIRG